MSWLETLKGQILEDDPKPTKVAAGPVSIPIGGGSAQAISMPSQQPSAVVAPATIVDGFVAKLRSKISAPGVVDKFEAAYASLALTFVASLLIAYATVLPIFRPFATLVSAGRFNGMIGLPLVFLSLLHNPHWVKVALLVFGAGVFTVLSLVRMIEAIPQELFDHSRTLKMGEWRVVWEVVVLGQFDIVLDIFRVNAAMTWMLLPMVEGYFRFEGGVGTLMLTEAKHLNLDSVFCIMFIVLLIGFAQDWIIGQFRSILCPYADLGVERK